MPSGPVLGSDYDAGYDNPVYQHSPISPRRYRQQPEESGSEILYSVKEQEAQFEQLTRELEAERYSVANQLERCKLGSENTSICSVPSNGDLSQSWRQNDSNQNKDQSSHLYDSCLDYGQDLNDSIRSGTRVPSNEAYRQVETYKTQTVNGPPRRNSLGSESPHSSRMSVNSNMSNDIRGKKLVTTTLTTKVTTHRQVYHNGPYNGSGGPNSPAPMRNSPRIEYGQNEYDPQPHDESSVHIQHRLETSYDGSDYNRPQYQQPDYQDNYHQYQPRDQLPPGDTSYDSRLPEVRYAGVRDPHNDSYRGDPNDSYRDQQQPPSYDEAQRPGDPEAVRRENMYPNYRNYSILPQDLDRSRESGDYPGGYPANESFNSGVPNGEYRPLREQYSQDESFRRSPSPQAIRRYEDPYQRLPGDEDGYRPHGEPPGSVHDTSVPPGGFLPHGTGNPDDPRWRTPDLHEVIEFLSHPSNSIKANAAAYLQHLTFGDPDVKHKTRALHGIPALVELVNNEQFDVHKNALGALRNLSFGRENDENKRAIKNADGLPALVRHLRRSPDNDIRELVTAVLWNLSSCKDLKKPVIDEALTVLVNNIIIPHSGWDDHADMRNPKDIYWSTVFRNASGVLRNISSEGEYGRKKLRECEGLVDAIMYIVRAAIGKNDIDNKSVENCVCVLRNLCYGCQEVQDPDYWKKKHSPKGNKPGSKLADTIGCFGAGKKKKEQAKNEDKIADFQKIYPKCDPHHGMGLLWNPDVVHVYLPLLSDCSNPETLEAAAGAVQNLAACEWQPSIELRAAVRKEKGLPVIVELLNIEEDRVVCAAATSLRNLALDQRNKELIGKYAMHKLIQKLPSKSRRSENPPSDATVAAVLATLYEVVKNNPDFCQTLLNNEGVDRLVDITTSRGEYSSKVVKFAASILFAMWQFKDLHEEYKRHGYRESHFVTKTMAARAAAGRPPESANNTLVRPRQDLGRPSTEFNASTMPPINRQKYNQDSVQMPNDIDYGGGENPYHAPSVFDQRRPENHHPTANNVSANYADYPTEAGGRRDYYPGDSASVHNDSAARLNNMSSVGGGALRFHGNGQPGGVLVGSGGGNGSGSGSGSGGNGSVTGGGLHDNSMRYQDDITPYGTAINPYGRGMMNESRDSDRFVEPYARDDRMLLRGAATEDIQLQEMTNPSYSTSGDYHGNHRPIGGVSVLPPQQGSEPLYARVNKAHKSRPPNAPPPAHMTLDTSQQGGDSWV